MRRIIESGKIPNLIFYGPSGTGKTTVASIIAAQTSRTLYQLNATTAAAAEVKEILAQPDMSWLNGVLLYLDEIPYFTKKQQQSLLESIEDGSVTLIASTTENPYFYVYGAILSRSTVFEFQPISPRGLTEIRPARRSPDGAKRAGEGPARRREHWSMWRWHVVGISERLWMQWNCYFLLDGSKMVSFPLRCPMRWRSRKICDTV